MDYFFSNDQGYYGYFIGGENLGWRADENNHTNGDTLTYRFDSGVTEEYRTLVEDGAELWAGVVSIEEKTNGTGLIKLVTDPEADFLAKFTGYISGDYGHLIGWELHINRAKAKSSKVIAHEFAHAIGLIDLYDASNNDKLMYHAPLHSSATGPTSKDIVGAQVITGQHIHTWSFVYYTTNTRGNVHIATTCPSCGGDPASGEQCTYNANNVCRKCGVPYGVQPYAHEENTEIK